MLLHVLRSYTQVVDGVVRAVLDSTRITMGWGYRVDSRFDPIDGCIGMVWLCTLIPPDAPNNKGGADKTMPKMEAREKAIQYSREHKIDRSVIMTVAGAANMKLNYNALAEKGDGDMCTLFEEIAKENEAKGEAKGKAEGKAEGIIKMLKKYKASDNNIIKELASELGISMIAAEEYLAKYDKGIL